MEINCPFTNNIECSVNGALDFYCQSCGFFPAEQKRRKKALAKHYGEIETERRKNIMQLQIQHKGKKVSYSIRRVRKLTVSSKYHRVSNSGQPVESKTRPDQTRPDHKDQSIGGFIKCIAMVTQTRKQTRNVFCIDSALSRN